MELNEQSVIANIRQTNSDSALKIIHETMPQKILDLNAMVQGIQTRHSESNYSVESYHSRKSIPCNPEVMSLFEIIKNQIKEMVDLLGELKLWVRLNIPKIEDGNNFGVGVQEEVLLMVQTGLQSGIAVLEHITKFYFSRARLITKSAKHPGVLDYARAVTEMDQKQYFNLLESCKDLRNNYILLWDKIMKNLDKISKPRGSDDSSNIMIF